MVITCGAVLPPITFIVLFIYLWRERGLLVGLEVYGCLKVKINVVRNVCISVVINLLIKIYISINLFQMNFSLVYFSLLSY